MDSNPISKGMIIRNSGGLGEVSREMINRRARELALLSGRIPPEITDADFEQAERELTGGPERDAKEEIMENLPESERWDPVPGSAGRRAPEVPSEEEDDQGRNESAQLIEEGVQEAEHDQMLEAQKAAKEDEERSRDG
jgi:hypothetical protein